MPKVITSIGRKNITFTFVANFFMKGREMGDLHVNAKSATKTGYGKLKNKVCVRKASGEVVNTTRAKAEVFVNGGGAYVPRSVWKKEVRDIKVETNKVETENKPKKKKGNPKGKTKKD